MKLCFTSFPGHAWGGSEVLWASAAAEAARRGRTVVALPGWGMGSSPHFQAVRDAGGTVGEHMEYTWDWRGELKRRMRLASKPFREAKPDAVVLNQGSTYDLVTAAAIEVVDYLVKQRIPYIILCHNNDERTAPSEFGREATRRIFAHARVVGFCCDRHRVLAERQLAMPLKGAWIFRNPVNLQNPELRPYPQSDRPLMAMVGWLDNTRKGYPIVLEVLSDRKWKQRDWKLSIFGSGQDFNALQELIEFYGLGDHVKMMGATNDIDSVWRSNQVLVQTSFQEGVPLSMVEAMLCGRPCIVTNVGGMTDWVTDGETGFVCESATLALLDETMERALANHHRWEQMGKRAHEVSIGRLGDPVGELVDIAEAVARHLPLPHQAPTTAMEIVR